MKVSLIIFVASFLLTPVKDEKVKVYWVEKGDYIQIYAQNSNIYPITLEFNADLTNLETNKIFPVIMTIPSGSESHLLNLKIIKRSKKWDYSATYTYYMGDIEADHNDHFAYRLPYSTGSEYLISQGYNGIFSHSGDSKHALDFQMDTGSGIYASRGGLVVEVVEKNNKGGPIKAYMPYTNYITIMHNDGTFADYSHLELNGAMVEIGQHVTMGQLIGYSGSTGFASGPHLHFIVKKTKKHGGFISIPVKFTTRKGIIELKEGEVYGN